MEARAIPSASSARATGAVVAGIEQAYKRVAGKNAEDYFYLVSLHDNNELTGEQYAKELDTFTENRLVPDLMLAKSELGFDTEVTDEDIDRLREEFMKMKPRAQARPSGKSSSSASAVDAGMEAVRETLRPIGEQRTEPSSASVVAVSPEIQRLQESFLTAFEGNPDFDSLESIEALFKGPDYSGKGDNVIRNLLDVDRRISRIIGKKRTEMTSNPFFIKSKAILPKFKAYFDAVEQNSLAPITRKARTKKE